MGKKYGAVVKIVNHADYVESVNDLIEDGTLKDDDEEIKDYLAYCAREDFGWEGYEIEMSIVELGAKFDSPFEWLKTFVSQGEISEQKLLEIISKHCNPDDIQKELELFKKNSLCFDKGLTF